MGACSQKTRPFESFSRSQLQRISLVLSVRTRARAEKAEKRSSGEDEGRRQGGVKGNLDSRDDSESKSVMTSK